MEKDDELDTSDGSQGCREFKKGEGLRQFKVIPCGFSEVFKGAQGGLRRVVQITSRGLRSFQEIFKGIQSIFRWI